MIWMAKISHPNESQYILELKTAEACEHSGIPLSMDCGDNVINIKHAAYGVYSNDNTCGRFYDGDCLSETSLQVPQKGFSVTQ
mgnify:CR=1 FL=1